MADDKMIYKLPHNLILEDRKSLTISGVADVDSFDEETIIVFTEQGELAVKGKNLHINKLSVETGELSVEGLICELIYSDEQPQHGGFFSRIFK